VFYYLIICIYGLVFDERGPMINDNLSIRTRKENGKTVHHIKWISKPVNKHAFIQLAKWLDKHNDYAPINDSKMQALSHLLATVNGKYATNISMGQLFAIRNIAVKHKIIRNFSRMNTIIDEIAAQYCAGATILKLSQKYDFPPLNLLRGIFIYLNYDTAAVYAIFANKSGPTDVLSGRDLEQYKLAEENDAENSFDQQSIAKIALDNETMVINYLISLGINLRTQDQLTAEQTKTFGRAVLTPDVLFTDVVYVNDHRIFWLDYKDYMGTNTKFLYRSNYKQVEKYTKEWGPGALCFHYSFTEDMNIPRALMLDGSILPINLAQSK
jgi:hypothetical protein